MKSILRKLSFCALLGVSISAHAAPVLIPNGDFSIPAGANFSFFQPVSGIVTFPATGGSGDDGGYGLVNNTAPGAIWGGGLVSPSDFFYEGNQGIPLANLGLVAGNTYIFSMDMKNFAGTGTGGIKLEAWTGGPVAESTSGNLAASGSSNQWANYSWNYTIPAGTTSIKIVPLVINGDPPVGSGASNADSVGFDNIKVNNTPVPPPPFVPDQIPNGDFEAGGANWNAFAPGGPTITFPDSEGNPSGHAVIDATAAEGFAAIEAFGGAEKTFASLGLAPGDSYTIQLDMKILEGSNIGGVQLIGANAYTAPAPGLERPTIIGDGSTWKTYSIPLTVPTAPAQARFTFLWGNNSKVAYDNIKIVLPAPAGPLQATIAQGTTVSWSAGSAVNQYQPQESADIGGPYTNLGPALIGNSVSSVFDSGTSPFYQVLESVPTITETAYNGNFNEEGIFADEAAGWEEAGSQPPLRLLTGGRTDNGACMQLMVMNSATVVGANDSVLLQNTFNVAGVSGEVVPGNTYDFSLWAKQVSKTTSYEQRYIVKFLDGIGNIISNGVFQNFPLPVTGNWVQFTQNGLIAPAGAKTALIEIVAVVGADLNESGEVLIDDVTLISTGFGSPAVLAATATPSVEISWPSTTGQDYQVQSSPDLDDWSNFGGVISGDDTTKAVYDAITPPAKFYKVGELP